MNINILRYFSKRIGDVKDEVGYIKINFEEIRDVINIIIGFGIIELFSVYVLGIKFPIDTTNTSTIIRSLFILWGYLFLTDSVFLLPYLLLSRKHTGMTWYTDRYERIILIIALLISTQIKIGRFIDILGIIGFGLMIILYIYFGKWPVIPGNAVSHYYQTFGIPAPLFDYELMDDSNNSHPGGASPTGNERGVFGP